MEVLVIGICTAFNFIVILFKISRNRILDALLDVITFIAISALFTGTISGMSVGMVASATVSIYLWFRPPKFPKLGKEINLKEFAEEFKARL